MSVSTYVPDSTKILHIAYADFVSRQIGRTVHVVQYDDSLPLLAVKLFSDGQPYTIPSNANLKNLMVNLFIIQHWDVILHGILHILKSHIKWLYWPRL